MNELVAPIVGGIIGYITNGIAIKMLFRPLKPVYVFGKQLPFTPGIIPKEKARIAKSVARAVNEELLNEEILAEALLKPEIFEAIEAKVSEWFKYQEHNEESFEHLASRVIGKDRVVYLKCEGEEVVTEVLSKKVIEMNIGHLAMERLVQAFNEGKINLGALSFFINGSVIESLGEKIEPLINEMIASESEALIRKAVEDESEALLERPVSDLVKQLKNHEAMIQKILVQAYEYAVRKKLADALKVINMASVIEARINAYEPLEMERLILDIMKKELNAIVWLGALLGAIMGCLMNFLP